MKKTKVILFSLITKGQLVFVLICIIAVLSTSITLDIITTTNLSLDERYDYVVVIDAGHGGIDPGSIGYKTKVRESEVNLAVATFLQEKLNKIGLRVIMTRSDNNGLYGLSTVNYKKRDMQKRREIIQAARPDIVISIHMNSYIKHNLRGAQVFYDRSSPISEALALSIQEQFATNLEKSDKGVSVGDYYMLKCTEAASVIAECGFLSNEEDEKLLLLPEYQNKIADCICVGVVNYLNLQQSS